MSLSIKKGVRVFGMSVPILLAVLVAEGVYAEFNFPLTITAGIDGKHADFSSHYSGNAVDLRTNGVPPDQQVLLLKAIQDRLTEDYFAQIEVDHIHIQFRPHSTYTN